MIMIYEYESYDLLIYIIYDICYIYNRVALPFSRVSVQFPATIWQKLLDSHPFSLIQCWLQVCLSFLVSTPCRSFFRLGPTLRQEGDGIFGILKQFKYFYENMTSQNIFASDCHKVSLIFYCFPGPEIKLCQFDWLWGVSLRVESFGIFSMLQWWLF